MEADLFAEGWQKDDWSMMSALNLVAWESGSDAETKVAAKHCEEHVDESYSHPYLYSFTELMLKLHFVGDYTFDIFPHWLSETQNCHQCKACT